LHPDEPFHLGYLHVKRITLLLKKWPNHRTRSCDPRITAGHPSQSQTSGR
jgi:hypothetical protein